MRGGVRGVATTTTAALLSSQRENPVVLRTLNVVHEICPAGVVGAHDLHRQKTLPLSFLPPTLLHRGEMGGEGLCLLSFLPPTLLQRVAKGEMGEEGLGMRLRKT